MNHFKLRTVIFLFMLCIAIAGESQASENAPPAEKSVQADQGKTLGDEAIIREKYPNAIRTASGLLYIVVKAGARAKSPIAAQL